MNIKNNTKCLAILALLIHSAFSSSQNRITENKENEKIGEENNCSKTRKTNKDDVPSESKSIRKFNLNPNAAIFTPSSTPHSPLPESSSNKIASRNLSYPDSGMVSPGSYSNRKVVYNPASPDPNLVLPELSSSRRMDSKPIPDNRPVTIIPVLPGQIVPLYVPQYNQYNMVWGVNPYLNSSPVSPYVSPSHPAIGTSTSPESKIRPFLEEMSLMSQKARAEDPTAPEFTYDATLRDFVIIMHENLPPVKPALEEVKPTINKIIVYDSSLKIIYEGYPRLDLDSIEYSYDTRDYHSIDSSRRKSIEQIGIEIKRLTDGKLLVGFKLKATNFHDIYGIPNFERRDLGSLIKFCDMVETKPFNLKKFNVREWKLKDLAMQFFGNTFPELRSASFSREMVLEYFRKLYLHFRVKWEAEVQFLEKQVRYYKYVKKVEMALIFSQYGPHYPGLHKDGNEFALEYAKSVVPENLYGIHVTMAPKTRNIIESLSIYKADNLRHLFSGFVEIDSATKGPGKKYYTLSEVARISVSILEQKKKFPRVITGYDILRRLRLLDQKRELLYVTVYDTKKIFYGTSVTELAYRYLHVDYRLRYFQDWKERNLTSEEAFVECDRIISIELLARISLQLFRLYGLHEHPSVVGVPVWNNLADKKKNVKKG